MNVGRMSAKLVPKSYTTNHQESTMKRKRDPDQSQNEKCEVVEMHTGKGVPIQQKEK
jgi:hypothetical protein